MGKFKFSKRAYLKEIKEKRDWEPSQTEAEKERPDVNKTRRCYKFAGTDGSQGAAITVEIKAGKCDSSHRCSSLASQYRQVVRKTFGLASQCKFR